MISGTSLMKLAVPQASSFVRFKMDSNQAIGHGASEIRIHVLGEWRVIYVAKFRDAVYVLHAFQKKTRRTSQHDIDLARRRYGQIGGNV